MKEMSEENEQTKGEEEEWETDEEKTVFFRVVLENASKIKNDINKVKSYHTKRIKKLEKKEIDSAEDTGKYIDEKIIPFLKINENEDDGNIPYVSVKDNDYYITEKPEIGTNLIIEISNEQDLRIVGISQRYFEANVLRPKKRTRKKSIDTNKNEKIENIAITGKKEKKKKKIPPIIPNHIKNNTSLVKFSGQKRNRPKRRYIKQSTIIEIKKI